MAPPSQGNRHTLTLLDKMAEDAGIGMTNTRPVMTWDRQRHDSQTMCHDRDSRNGYSVGYGFGADRSDRYELVTLGGRIYDRRLTHVEFGPRSREATGSRSRNIRQGNGGMGGTWSNRFGWNRAGEGIGLAGKGRGE
jgi:hypothetical protein